MRGTMSNETPSRIETTSDGATRLEKRLARARARLASSAAPPASPPPPLDPAVLPSTCYYINMESARHRRRRMDVLLARHGLKAHRVRATTPQDERFAQQLEKCASQADVPDRHAETVPPPLRANTLSHVEVWRSIAACPNEDEATLVLEDDVMLLHTWRAELAACLSSLPADWQLFMLDSLPIEAEWYFADGCAVAAPTPLNAAPYGKVLYLDAYVLRPSGARWLLERHEAYPRAGGEDLMCDLQLEGRSWFTHPKKLAVQTWIDSSISGQGFASTMAAMQAHYFSRIPKRLYDDPPYADDDGDDGDEGGATEAVGRPPATAATQTLVSLPPIATTTSPNYTPCFTIFEGSLMRAGYCRESIRVQTLQLPPPFGVGTPSWHAAISASLRWVVTQIEAAETSAATTLNASPSFLLKSDADIQFFETFPEACRRWIADMEARSLDLLCMREADLTPLAVNGGLYLLRCNARMRAFMEELIRCSSTAPGALHDQEHLNRLLGLGGRSSGGQGADGPLSTGVGWGGVRYAILPEEEYIWATNLMRKDLTRVAFHHAVAETGVVGKVRQLVRVRAEVGLCARDGRPATQLASLRCDGCGVQSKLHLRPYTTAHVPVVVGWQHSEPELIPLLGLDEADDVDSEIECVRSLERGEQPCMLCLAVMAPQVQPPSATSKDTKGVLCGTVSVRLELPRAFPNLPEDGSGGEAERAAAAALATDLFKEDASGTPPLEAEVEIEMEKSHRRRGFGREALEMVLCQLSIALPELEYAIAKVPIANAVARAFFESAGFGEVHTCTALGHVELRRRLVGDTAVSVRSPLLPPAYYINVDARTDRRLQIEAALRRGGLDPTRVSACTPADEEVQWLARICPGKLIGWHANAASHIAVWRRIAEGAGQEVGTADGPPPLSLVFEDDVVLHRDWQRLLARTLEAAARSEPMPQSVADERSADASAVTVAEGSNVIDAIFLDGLFMVGEASAEHGWLGPRNEGPQRALGVVFSSAYALTPDAARWLLQRHAEQPGSNAEAYLMQLQEERGRCWTHAPRLALQRWDEEASSVSELSPVAMHRWYERNYFTIWPRTEYLF